MVKRDAEENEFVPPPFVVNTVGEFGFNCEVSETIDARIE
jgi:hypothetical protein